MSEYYGQAAEIVDDVLRKKGSAKSLSFNRGHGSAPYAIASETLKFLEIIKEIVAMIPPLLKEKPTIKPSLLYVLVYDLLFGQGIRGSGRAKKAVLRYKVQLDAALARIKIRRKVQHNRDLLPAYLRFERPRYARINTLRTNADQVIAYFQSQGFRLACPNEELTSGAESKIIRRDDIVPDLLALPGTINFFGNPLVEQGDIILQDKASCFSALVAAPEDGWSAIDACAAPGNKTTHLAALMHNRGQIFALDADPERHKLLRRMIARATVTIAETECKDFLSVDPSDLKYAQVRVIVVDPSCSGSGIVGRGDLHLTSTDSLPSAQPSGRHAHNSTRSDEQEDEHDDGSARGSETLELGRRHALAKFQRAAVLHALKFPNVQRVVYSTCSIDEIENEQVVAAVLDADPRFDVVPALPSWPRRGLPSFPFGERCVRTDPTADATIGFFVACFERRSAVSVSADSSDADTSDEALSTAQADDGAAVPAAASLAKRKRKKKHRQKKKKRNKASGQGAGSGP